MNESMVRIGQRVINLNAIRDARRDGPRLWLNCLGGGYVVIDGAQADVVWRILVDGVTDLGGGAEGKVTTHD